MKTYTLVAAIAGLMIGLGWQQNALAQASTTLSEYSYDTELMAVVAATRQYNPQSIAQDREFIGAILSGSGRYYFTVAAGKPGQDRVSTKLRYPKSMQLVALWHTHGAEGTARDLFSDTDTDTAQKFDMPFYMVDYTNVLKVFRPEDKVMSPAMAMRHGLKPIRGYAQGQVVLSL